MPPFSSQFPSGSGECEYPRCTTMYPSTFEPLENGVACQPWQSYLCRHLPCTGTFECAEDRELHEELVHGSDQDLLCLECGFWAVDEGHMWAHNECFHSSSSSSSSSENDTSASVNGTMAENGESSSSEGKAFMITTVKTTDSDDACGDHHATMTPGSSSSSDSSYSYGYYPTKDGKTLKCLKCAYTTKKEKTMITHMHQNHWPSNQPEMARVLYCYLCSHYSSSSERNLRSHIYKIHDTVSTQHAMLWIKYRIKLEGQDDIPPELSPLVCHFCQFETMKKYNMKQHLRQQHKNINNDELISTICQNAGRSTSR